jgi:hypothetical protein
LYDGSLHAREQGNIPMTVRRRYSIRKLHRNESIGCFKRFQSVRFERFSSLSLPLYRTGVRTRGTLYCRICIAYIVHIGPQAKCIFGRLICINKSELRHGVTETRADEISANENFVLCFRVILTQSTLYICIRFICIRFHQHLISLFR